MIFISLFWCEILHGSSILGLRQTFVVVQKSRLSYVEFYADFKILQKMAGRHKSYKIKFVWGHFYMKFLSHYLYGGSVVLG